MVIPPPFLLWITASPFFLLRFLSPSVPFPFVKSIIIFVSHFLAVPPPRPPVIMGLEREEVTAGRMLVLDCVSQGGNPLATLHWTKVNILRNCNYRLSHKTRRFISRSYSVCIPLLWDLYIVNCITWARRTAKMYFVMQPVWGFKCPSVCQNGEVVSKTWEEDAMEQKSSSILHLMITPADNQAELCCESVNLVSLSPLSVSRKITVLCEWK